MWCERDEFKKKDLGIGHILPVHLNYSVEMIHNVLYLNMGLVPFSIFG